MRGYFKFGGFEQKDAEKNSNVDDVIDAGLQLNQYLIDFYHQLAEIAPIEELATFFSSLEVKEIAEKLEVPAKMINKTPSAELVEDQTDEKDLGMSYEELDLQLMINYKEWI